MQTFAKLTRLPILQRILDYIFDPFAGHPFQTAHNEGAHGIPVDIQGALQSISVGPLNRCHRLCLLIVTNIASIVRARMGYVQVEVVCSKIGD